jgi:hypothetical protein
MSRKSSLLSCAGASWQRAGPPQNSSRIGRSDTIEPAASALRQDVGGFSCAQPNHADAKKPNTAAVAALSRTNL